MMISRTRLPVLLISLMVLLACVGCANRPTANNAVQAAGEQLQSDALLQHFLAVHTDKEVIKIARADVNNTGTEDMVVIYQDIKDKKMMEVVFDAAGKLKCSNQVPAPASNQLIQFKDIDKQPPLEFIVQGTKGAKVGYAIYRLQDGRLADLFGEGMEDCC